MFKATVWLAPDYTQDCLPQMTPHTYHPCSFFWMYSATSSPLLLNICRLGEPAGLSFVTRGNGKEETSVRVHITQCSHNTITSIMIRCKYSHVHVRTAFT